MIPLHLSIESTDEKALTTTSNPNAPNVALLRTIALGYGFGGAPVEHPDKTRLANEHHMTQVPKVRSVDEVQSATWWADPGAKPSAGKRELQGELHLDRQLYSTGHISLFDLFVRPLRPPAFAASLMRCCIVACSIMLRSSRRIPCQGSNRRPRMCFRPFRSKFA